MDQLIKALAVGAHEKVQEKEAQNYALDNNFCGVCLVVKGSHVHIDVANEKKEVVPDYRTFDDIDDYKGKRHVAVFTEDSRLLVLESIFEMG